MAESMKDFEQELEASFKKIEEGDIIAGTVVSVDELFLILNIMLRDLFRQRNFPESRDLILKRQFSREKRSRQPFLGKMTDREIFFFPEQRQQMYLHGIN